MKSFTIDRLNAGKRIFRFIASILVGAKKSDIFKMLRKKVICVNKKKTAPEYILSEGDQVVFYIADSYFKTTSSTNKGTKKGKLPIVYEDSSVLVINKPRGVLVHPGKNKKTASVIENIKAYLNEKGEYSYTDLFSPALCNRLDVYTTGLLVAAKTHESLKEITRLFRERKVDKQYLAICYRPLEKACLITSMIDDSPSNNMVFNRQLDVLDPAALSFPSKEDFIIKHDQVSATLIEPLASSELCSLVKIDLWTGKKHQIRAHLKGINHPLLGDRKYFSKKSKLFSDKQNMSHYFLHAFRLKLDENRCWTAHIPADFKKEVQRLFNTSIHTLLQEYK